jgi:hypothetical protein
MSKKVTLLSHQEPTSSPLRYQQKGQRTSSSWWIVGCVKWCQQQVLAEKGSCPHVQNHPRHVGNMICSVHACSRAPRLFQNCVCSKILTSPLNTGHQFPQDIYRACGFSRKISSSQAHGSLAGGSGAEGAVGVMIDHGLDIGILVVGVCNEGLAFVTHEMPFEGSVHAILFLFKQGLVNGIRRGVFAVENLRDVLCPCLGDCVPRFQLSQLLTCLRSGHAWTSR